MNNKKMFLLAAVAGMLGSANDVYGAPTRFVPDNRSREENKRTAEKKKCKSCKHFVKRDGKCFCSMRTGYWGVNPLQPACSSYKKRN